MKVYKLRGVYIASDGTNLLISNYYCTPASGEEAGPLTNFKETGMQCLRFGITEDMLKKAVEQEDPIPELHFKVTSYEEAFTIYKVPVTWQMTTELTVLCTDIDEAADTACRLGVSPKELDSGRYVNASIEACEDEIEPVQPGETYAQPDTEKDT